MGLISKIEDKLSGSKSDSNKLEKSSYDSHSGSSGTTSKLQNPISSASGNTSGTYGSSTGTTSGQSYGSRAQDAYDSRGQDTYGSRPQDSSGYTSSSKDRGTGVGVPGTGSGIPGTQGYRDGTTADQSYGSRAQDAYDSRGQDTYGSRPQGDSGYTSSGRAHDTSGYTSSSTKDRMPGSYVTDEDHIPSNTTNTTTTTTVSGARQPYDPYSSKGQETAARAGTTGYGSSESRDYDRIGSNDPSLLRSKDGGIMNQQSSDSRYATQQPSSTSATTGQHHYGRDAAIIGGTGATGAAGIGAYEMGKDHPSSQPLTSTSGQQQYQDPSHTNQPQYVSRDTMGQQQYQDPSYMSQPQQSSRDATMAGGAMQPGAMGGEQQSPMGGQSQGGMAGESAGLTQARKMGGAYEAGYKDAMEHMKQEMAQKGSGSAF